MCLCSTEIMLSAAALFFFSWSLCRNMDIPSLEKLAPLVGLSVVISALLAFGAHGIVFAGAYQLDGFSQFVKVLLAVGYAITLLISKGIGDIEDRHRPEYYLFLTTATLGLVFLVSAVDLLTLYVSLELSSYSLYLLIPLRKGNGRTLESGIKYLLLGVASSGVMAYGLSLLFGLTQSTNLYDVAIKLPELAHVQALWVAMFLVLVPILFKLSLVPFHFWAPDVYEGGNTQTVGFISTVSKVAALAVFIRFAMLMEGVSSLLVQVWVWLAVGSMTFGNLAALSQKDVKRMLAYSSISQAGYMLVGCLCQDHKGLSATMFYSAVYILMALAVFMVMGRMSPRGDNLAIRDFRGLSSKSPLLALTLMLSLFSLAGVPPLAGFTGKWFLFSNAAAHGHMGVAIVGILNSVLSLYYYLAIVREAYTPVEKEESSARLVLGPMTVIACGVFVVVLVLTGFFPGMLMAVAERSVAVFY